MNLSLSAIETALKEVEIEAAASEINLIAPNAEEVRFERDVTARMTTRRVAEEFFVSGQVKTKATMRCARCLVDYEAQLSAAVELVIHRVNDPSSTGDDLDSYAEIPVGATSFDVSPYVREALLLSVPDVPRCRDECLGLCAQCGTDLNLKSCDCEVRSTDPRWNGLKQFSTSKR